MRNLCKLLLALALAGVNVEVACATNITAASNSISIGATPISTGVAVFVPVDSSGHGIAVTQSAGGLSLPVTTQPTESQPLGYTCTLAGGGVSGTCTVPDAGTSSPSGFAYNVTICDTSEGNATSGQCAMLVQVHNITGATWQLDHYSALASVSFTGVFTSTQGVGAPTGVPSGISFYTDITTPTAPVLYEGVAGVWQALGGSGGAVTATAIAAALGSRGGCNTANNAYVPNTNNCLPVLPLSGGTMTGPIVLSGDPTTSAQAATKNYVDTHSGSGGALKPVNALYLFGDSYLFGAGATSNQTGVFALLARDTPAPASNFAVNGYTIPQIANSTFANFVAHPTIPSVTMIDGGANSDDSCGGVSVSNCITNFKNGLSAIEAWVTIPYQYRVMASACTEAGGSWFPIVSLPLAVPVYSLGIPQRVFANGATLTCSLPTSTSTTVGLTIVTTNGGTGSFTVSIDGTPRIDNCTGTTTWTSATCATIGGVTSTFARQEFTVAPGAHTVVITSTSANEASFVSVDVVPPSGVTNENAVFVAGVDLNYGTVYNNASQALATQLKTDGLPVFFVDFQHGTPGVNNTTDISQTATATCPATLVGGHPNDCGYANFLATINTTEAASGYVFSSFEAGGQNPAITGQMLGPIRVPGSTINRASAYSNFSSSQGAQEVGVDWYATGQYFGVGFGQDVGTGLPFSGSFMSRNYGTFGWHCNQLFDGSALYGMSHYTPTSCWEYTSGRSYQLGPAMAAFFAPLEGTAIASASTIAPVKGVFHVTGTVAISTMTPPATCIVGVACQVTIIPDAVFAIGTGGNFALGTTAVVGKALIETYDATTAKWYPSY